MPHGHHQPVNLGLLGSGFVAGFYMDGLRDVPGAHVVANYSRSADRAERFGRDHDIPRQYTEVEALVADEDVDIVVVALPNHLHVDAIRAAAQAGKAIVCTKPSRPRSSASSRTPASCTATRRPRSSRPTSSAPAR
jgi:predicted dehydrogenase